MPLLLVMKGLVPVEVLPEAGGAVDDGVELLLHQEVRGR